MKHFMFSGFLCIAAAGGVVLAAQTSLDGYYSDLKQWRDSARAAPEGPATADLFHKAVQAGAITWDPDSQMVELRRDVPLAEPLSQALFRLNEAGATIKAEVSRTQALNRYVALRAHFTDCSAPCPDRTQWRIEASQGRGTAERLAKGAAWSQSRGVPAPQPRQHALFSRGAGGGYEPWQSWRVQDTLSFSAPLDGVSVVDIVGDVQTVSPGWRVDQSWCRAPSGRLASCDADQTAAAARLKRTDPQAPLTLTLAPRPVLPEQIGAGTHHISERIVLKCKDAETCAPQWVPLSGTRKFAKPVRAQSDADSVLPELTAATKVLGPWVTLRDDGTLMPSDMARATGAQAVIGGVPARPGSILAEIDDLDTSTSAKLSLDPTIQRIAHRLLTDLVERRKGGAFANMSYRFPSGGPRASLVVVDLRDADAPGAILAAVGTPELKLGLSSWDAAALPYDTRSPVAPGSAAWTGQGWQHTPGSVWKLLTALALIDGITGGTLPPETTSALRRVMFGVTDAEASRVLGPNALSGPGGICFGHRLSDGIKGAGSDLDCGKGFHRHVRDSGRGGPLANHRSASYGLVEALGLSSNIWFIATLVNAEAALARANSDAPSLTGQTAQRLGLLSATDLSAPSGMGLTPADAVQIDALDDPENVQALAFAAFGQQVMAGPLATAQLAASIALRRDVRPGLFTPMPQAAPLFSAQQADPLLTEVQLGMRAVVSKNAIGPTNRRGTAYGAFTLRAPALRARVAGKTGTAQRGSGNDRISTFAGWLDDRNGKPAIAVGCAATVRKTDKVPQLCANLVAELFAQLDREGALE